MFYKYIFILLLLPCLAESAPYVAEGFSRSFDFNITSDSNISKAWRNIDKRDDTVASMSFGSAYSNPGGETGLLILSGYIGYQGRRNYDDLELYKLSLSGRYLRQFDAGPTYHIGLELRTQRYADSNDSNDRNDRNGDVYFRCEQTAKYFSFNIDELST
ncbi:MAG: hypothetical protein ACI9CE_000885 [Flavobacterium sp.]|jgi:hypothetical protein